MEQLVINFCNDLLSLKALNDELSNFKKEDFDLLNQIIINNIEVLNKDKLIIICLLMSSLYNFDLSNFSYDIHCFLSSVITINNSNVSFLVKHKNTFLYTIDNLLFIINNNNYTINILLPDGYRNQNLYCLNCSDEMDLNDDIDVFSYSFYILEKEIR